MDCRAPVTPNDLNSVAKGKAGAGCGDATCARSCGCPNRSPSASGTPGVAPDAQVVPIAFTIDQAIFTSVRGPMGNGYRIVATSAGVSAEEQREITQRAPSHGSLCGDQAGATGLAWFTLSGGRQALFVCHNAGPEYSGRGGQRVHTHVLLLNQDAMAAIGGHPIRLFELAAPEIERYSKTLPSGRIEPIRHSARAAASRVGDSADVASTAWVGATAVLLAGGPAVLSRAHDGRQMLQALFNCLPAGLRAASSFSLGLKFTPVRPFRLVVLPDAPPELERLAMDSKYKVQPADAAATALAEPATCWIEHVRRMVAAGRWDHVTAQADALTGIIDTAVLAQVAELCRNLDEAAGAAKPRLVALSAEWAKRTAEHALPRKLRSQLLEITAQRLAEFAEAEAAEEAARAAAARLRAAAIEAA